MMAFWNRKPVQAGNIIIHIGTVVFNIATSARSTESAVSMVVLDRESLKAVSDEVLVQVFKDPQQLERFGLTVNNRE